MALKGRPYLRRTPAARSSPSCPASTLRAEVRPFARNVGTWVVAGGEREGNTLRAEVRLVARIMVMEHIVGGRLHGMWRMHRRGGHRPHWPTPSRCDKSADYTLAGPPSALYPDA